MNSKTFKIAALLSFVFFMVPTPSPAEEHGFVFNLINAIGSKLGGKAWDFAANTGSNRDNVQSSLNAALDNMDNLDSKNNGAEDKYASNFAKTAKAGGEAAYDGVAKGYKAVGDNVMPEVTDVATKVVDKADDINKKVEQGKSLWDRLFGKDQKPQDVDTCLPDHDVDGGGRPDSQDGNSPGSSGVSDTVRQMDNSRNSTQAINSQPASTPPPSTGGGTCGGH